MSNKERLTNLCTFDPTKKPSATAELFSEVLGEIKEERAKKAKEAAREQIIKAIELQEKMDKLRKEFEGQYNKFDKELGKMLNRLEAEVNGKPTPKEDEPDNS